VRGKWVPNDRMESVELDVEPSWRCGGARTREGAIFEHLIRETPATITSLESRLQDMMNAKNTHTHHV
jgi:hypothetical protein